MQNLITTKRPAIKSQYIFWVIPILMAFIYLVIHIRIIIFPYQLEYREGAILLTTDAFLNGVNPFQVENNPLYINVYGIIYNWITLPFAVVAGNTLWVHRIITAIFIFGQVFLVSAVLRKQGVAWILTTTAGLFIWLSQIFYIGPLARPDAVGTFFFLASLLIPFLYDFSLRSIVTALFFGILGFYTKPYFILGFPLLLAYTFLAISKRRAFITGLIFVPVFVVTLWSINKVYEAYFLNIIFSHIADLNESIDYLIVQSLKFLRDYWCIFAICVVELIRLPKKSLLPPDRSLRIHLHPYDSPFIQPFPNYFVSCLFFCSAVIGFKLGRHTGNTMVYFYQFISPFLLIVFVQWVSKMNWQKNLVIALLLVNLLTQSAENLQPDLKSFKDPGWQQMEQVLEGRNEILNSPVSVSLLLEKHQTITDSGQSQYYFPLPNAAAFYYPDIDKLQQAGYKWKNSISESIRSRRFDLIMVDNFKMIDTALIQEYYRLNETVSISMPHTRQDWILQIWLPW